MPRKNEATWDSLIERSGEQSDRPPKPNLPPVSVLIPVRNEELNIGRCLEALAANSYPHDLMEVLILDGMSEDKTCAIAERYADSGWQLRVIPNSQMNRPAGLNLGVQEARAGIILRLDARTLIPPNYVDKCVETLLLTGADNVGGLQKPIWTSPMQEAIGLAMSTPFGVGNAQFRLGGKSGFVDTVYLGCYRREVFERVGLFDDKAAVITEEGDLNQRINQSGGKVYLNANIEAYYVPRERLRDQIQVYFRYGGSRMGAILKNGAPTSVRQLVAPVFFFLLVAFGAFSVYSSWCRVAFLGLVASYVACDLGVSIWLALRRRKLGLAPRLMLTFPCMHISFAVGFFKRLLQRPKPGFVWPN